MPLIVWKRRDWPVWLYGDYVIQWEAYSIGVTLAEWLAYVWSFGFASARNEAGEYELYLALPTYSPLICAVFGSMCLYYEDELGACDAYLDFVSYSPPWESWELSLLATHAELHESKYLIIEKNIRLNSEGTALTRLLPALLL